MKRTKINIITALLLQIMTVVHGFVLPRLILSYFGSDVNGLVQSVTQFLNYIQLFEGGVGAVIMASLYKPLAERDDEKISGIVAAAKIFFTQIALIYIVYTIALSLVYPIIVKTESSYLYICTLIIIIAISTIIQYLFSVSYRILLNADKRGYVVSLSQICFLVLSLGLSIVSLYIYPSIHVLKFVSVICYLISPVVFNIYVNKNYNINVKAKPDNKALSQRWNAFGQNLAFFIHNNTDIVILTFLSTLSNVSVYAVYCMIVLALRNLIKSISDAIAPSMGKVLAIGDRTDINQSFDYYEIGIGIITCICFTCCGLLIVPFVTVYTRNVNDANYVQPVFAALLTIAYGLYCYRDSCGNVIYAVGHIKETAKYAYIEAGINLVISLLLVKPLGLVGIAIGTFLAMLFRTVALAYYSHKIVLNRPILKWYKRAITFVCSSALSVFIFHSVLNTVDYSIGTWIIHAIVALLITSVCCISMCYFIDKTTCKRMITRFFGK